MNGCQRWRERRDTYRPAGEVIRTGEYDVAAVGEILAKGFVEVHHYSGTYPAARFRFGLYHRGALVGVAVFSHPTNDKVLTSVFPGPAAASAELGRFILLDQVPANGETWFLGQVFELLRRTGLEGVVSFSDPIARRTRDGAVVFPGHIGTIYQAHNARYLGTSTARTLRLLPDGQVFSARAAQKIRARERGWEYAVAQLGRAGAPRPAAGEDLGAWLRSWLARLTRPLRHPGNHRYAWALNHRRRRSFPAGQPYPKSLE